jgi:hypothetical protein
LMCSSSPPAALYVSNKVLSACALLARSRTHLIRCRF